MNEELKNRGFHDLDHSPKKIGGRMISYIRSIALNIFYRIEV
jgi:hypothetical protein